MRDLVETEYFFPRVHLLTLYYVQQKERILENEKRMTVKEAVFLSVGRGNCAVNPGLR